MTDELDSWRRETERLLAIEDRRLSRRLHRLFFRLARSVWWRLPRRLRDRLRPVLFRSARSPGRRADDLVALSNLAARRPAPRPITVGHVSVLVPTRDAGPDFARLLAGLAEQEGVESVDLIVVDSGSTDGTPERAAEAGAQVVSIQPEEFGHGRTRNQAAELATSDVLVFLVQDAILLGRTVLRDLAAGLQADPHLAGVSARQIPRSDADLFGAFYTWSHQHAVRAGRAELDGTSFERLDPVRRRAAAALDDVCAAVRRDAWAALRFRDVSFAEDLDFAVRASRAGWSFAVSDDVAVAHSHDRDSVYHLRRTLADRLYVSALMDDPLDPRTFGWETDEILAAATVLLEELSAAVSLAAEQPGLLAEQLARISSILDFEAPRLVPAGELARLAEFVASDLVALSNLAAPAERSRSLRPALNALLRWPPLAEFAAAQPHVEAAQLEPFAAKLAASVIGRALGDSARAGSTEVSHLLAGV